jgi:hypothetical protein
MSIEREYVEWYCRAIMEAVEQHNKNRGWDSKAIIYPEYGRRFTRIVSEDDRGSRHVHAFVDMTNGDVIKSAGWKAPQRGKNGLAVRFNLVDDESREAGFRAIDPYGSYLYEGRLRSA